MASLQTTVNIKQAYAVPGAFYDNSPRRVQPYILNGIDAVAAVAATVVGTFSGTGTANDTITVGGRVYTLKDTLAAAYDVKIGGTAALTAANFVAAINASGTAGTEYYTGTLANLSVSAAAVGAVVTLTARTAGTVGNSIIVGESGTGFSFADSATVLAGGTAAVDAVVPYISRAFTVDSSDETVANLAGSGAFAGILVNPKHNVHSGLTAGLDVPESSMGELCTMGRICVIPTNSVSIGYSGYYSTTTGAIAGFSGTDSQTGYTLISGSQFVFTDYAGTGIAVLSLTNA